MDYREGSLTSCKLTRMNHRHASRPRQPGLFLLLLLALMAGSGCAVKVAGGPDANSNFRESDSGYEAAWPSLSAVRAALGEPVESYAGGRIWVYEETYKGLWFSILPMVVRDGVIPLPGTHATPTPMFRVFEFDQQDAVTTQRLVDGTRRCAEGVCIGLALPRESFGIVFDSAYSGVFTLDAPEWYVAALPTTPPPGSCAVYLDDDRDYRGAWMQAWLDGAPAGWLLSYKSYLRWTVPAGTHELAARTRLFSALKRFRCADGESVYLYFKAEDGGRIIRRERAEALKELKKRRLVISNWPVGPLRPAAGKDPDLLLDWLSTGKTTLPEVTAELGTPDLRLAKPHTLIYTATAPEWEKITGIELGTSRFDQTYMLAAEFDESGVLANAQVLASNPLYQEKHQRGRRGKGDGRFDTRRRPLCSEDGICFNGGESVTQFASIRKNMVVQDFASKYRRPADGTCTVYLWSDSWGINLGITLDGVVQGYLYDRLWPTGIFIWQIPKGESVLAVEAVNTTLKIRPASAALTCGEPRTLKARVAVENERVRLDIKRGLAPPRVEVNARRYIPSPAGLFDEFGPQFSTARRPARSTKR